MICVQVEKYGGKRYLLMQRPGMEEAFEHVLTVDEARCLANELNKLATIAAAMNRTEETIHE